MSIAAISWVFRQEIKPSSLKFVLVALADSADDRGICWPSIEHITETTCQDRKTVIKSLDDLEERGWLVDTGKRMGRTNQVKVYRLTDNFFKPAPTTNCGKSTENGTLCSAFKPEAAHDQRPVWRWLCNAIQRRRRDFMAIFRLS